MKILRNNARPLSENLHLDPARLAESVAASWKPWHGDPAVELCEFAQHRQPALDEPSLRPLFPPAEQHASEQAALAALAALDAPELLDDEVLVLGLPSHAVLSGRREERTVGRVLGSPRQRGVMPALTTDATASI